MNISGEQYVQLVNKIAGLEAMLSDLKALITGLEPPAVKTAGEWFSQFPQTRYRWVPPKGFELTAPAMQAFAATLKETATKNAQAPDLALNVGDDLSLDQAEEVDRAIMGEEEKGRDQEKALPQEGGAKVAKGSKWYQRLTMTFRN
jgi:hypothetical protein